MSSVPLTSALSSFPRQTSDIFHPTLLPSDAKFPSHSCKPGLVSTCSCWITAPFPSLHHGAALAGHIRELGRRAVSFPPKSHFHLNSSHQNPRSVLLPGERQPGWAGLQPADPAGFPWKRRWHGTHTHTHRAVSQAAATTLKPEGGIGLQRDNADPGLQAQTRQLSAAAAE